MPVYTQNQIQFPKVMIIGPSGYVADVNSSGQLQTTGSGGGGSGTVTSVAGAGIATGTVTTSGSITVLGSGNTTTAATAGASIAAAPNNDIITADGSGNVKDSGVLISSLVTIAQVTVAYSATPTFNAATGSNFKIVLTGNVTSSTLSGASAGQTIIIEIVEDVTGGHTFVWPTNVKNGMNLALGQAIQSNETNIQAFYYDGTNAYAISPGMTYP